MIIIFSKDSVKALICMDSATKKRIRAAIEKLPDGDTKPLKGAQGTNRLRVGGWRILFSCMDDEKIYIRDIGPRGDIYEGVSS